MADGKLQDERPSRIAADTEVRIAFLPPFEREIGHCWLRRLNAFPGADELAAVADDDLQPTRSALRVYENGVPLGPAHAPHSTIRHLGAGAFSHWKDTIYFSSTDGTNPNSNGRAYELRVGHDDRQYGGQDRLEPDESGAPPDSRSKLERPASLVPAIASAKKSSLMW